MQTRFPYIYICIQVSNADTPSIYIYIYNPSNANTPFFDVSTAFYADTPY